jgi:glycosyltransferase involved in cell wall biosynthesis
MCAPRARWRIRRARCGSRRSDRSAGHTRRDAPGARQSRSVRRTVLAVTAHRLVEARASGKAFDSVEDKMERGLRPLLQLQPDLYQRYTMLRAIVASLWKPSAPGTMRLLDVGSGPDRLTERFLVQANVVRADIDQFGDDDIVKLEPNEPLPFDQRGFDLVVALEVLEHVPNEQRVHFVNECLRVAAHAVVFSCPAGTPGVITTERAFFRASREIAGRPIDFLLEHQALGLPIPNEVAAMIERAGWTVVLIENAPLTDWQLLNLIDFIYACDFGEGEEKAAFAERVNPALPLIRPEGEHYRRFFCAVDSNAVANRLNELRGTLIERSLLSFPDLEQIVSDELAHLRNALNLKATSTLAWQRDRAQEAIKAAEAAHGRESVRADMAQARAEEAEARADEVETRAERAEARGRESAAREAALEGHTEQLEVELKRVTSELELVHRARSLRLAAAMRRLLSVRGVRRSAGQVRAVGGARFRRGGTERASYESRHPPSLPSDTSDVTLAAASTSLGLLPFHPLNLRRSPALAHEPRVNVLLPSVAMRHMSGGPNTAIALAGGIASDGVPVRFLSTDVSPDVDTSEFWQHCARLTGLERLPANLELADAHDQSIPVDIGENDIFLATAWWTAQQAKYAVKLTTQPRFLYLIQDFEALFLPASSGQALALETYDLEHIPIVNSSLLLEFLSSNEIGQFRDSDFCSSALVFEPAIDRDLFRPREHASENRRRRVLLYARPTNGLRNLFELCVTSVRCAIAEGVLDPGEWDFSGIGENFEPLPLGGGAWLKPSPWFDLEAYAKELRESDILLACMLSPHPSYPPLEMAASGGMVVTTVYANKTEAKLRALSANIVGVTPTVEALVEGLGKAARRVDDWEDRGRAAEIPLPTSWPGALADVRAALVERLALLEGAPALPAATPFGRRTPAIAPGFAPWPVNRLDVHRRAALRRRLKEYVARPESAFLSFLTPVWNTEPRFLQELAESVLSQDALNVEFEWVVIDNGTTRSATQCVLDTLAADSRVRLHRSEDNLGIVGGLRACLENARYRYVAGVDHDDLLTPDCVRVLAGALQAASYPAIAYTDEDKIEAHGPRDAYQKPDWDPVLFANHAYIAHLGVFDRTLALELDLYSDPACEGSPDWDAFVRFVIAGYTPHHVPELLYSWRMHGESTAQRMSAKPVVFESQRRVIRRLLGATADPDRYTVEQSPLFDGTPDWWIRRSSAPDHPITTVVLGRGSLPSCRVDASVEHEIVDRRGKPWRESVAAAAEHCSESGRLLHILMADTIVTSAEWSSEAMTTFELYPDSVIIGGRIVSNGTILTGSAYLGFGAACDSPDRGRRIEDSGYMAQAWKPHSVSAVSADHMVVDPRFLLDVLTSLPPQAGLNSLGAWLGGLARVCDKRVVYSPFFAASTRVDRPEIMGAAERAAFRRAFLEDGPDERYLSKHVGLSTEDAFEPVNEAARHRQLISTTPEISYAEWLDADRAARQVKTTRATGAVSSSIITCVYEGSPARLFGELGTTVLAQTLAVTEWVIVADGPISSDLEREIRRVVRHESVRVVRRPVRAGIISSLRAGLEAASGDFVLPVDADDVLERDAWQTMNTALVEGDVDFVYSDEDVLTPAGPETPFLRPDYDTVLGLESPYIFHLSCFRRMAALDLGVFSSGDAELCHDFDTSLRFASAGLRFEHTPHVLYHWRRHSRSQSHSGRQNLDSVASTNAVLNRLISTFDTPQRYSVQPFPIYRRAHEPYIERIPSEPPAVLAVMVRGNGAATADGLVAPVQGALFIHASSNGLVSADRDALIAPGPEYVIVLDASVEPLSPEALWEAVKLFELHPNVVLVGGRIVNGKDEVVSSGWVLDRWKALAPAYDGMPRDDPGSWALALKAQSIASPAEGVFMIRSSFLREEAALLPPDLRWEELAPWLAGRAFASGRKVAYSPVIECRVVRVPIVRAGFSAEERAWRWRGGARGPAVGGRPPIFGSAALAEFFAQMHRAR